jgi:hypothetical protein
MVGWEDITLEEGKLLLLGPLEPEDDDIDRAKKCWIILYEGIHAYVRSSSPTETCLKASLLGDKHCQDFRVAIWVTILTFSES